jgi:hypothetical protein
VSYEEGVPKDPEKEWKKLGVRLKEAESFSLISTEWKKLSGRNWE